MLSNADMCDVEHTVVDPVFDVRPPSEHKRKIRRCLYIYYSHTCMLKYVVNCRSQCRIFASHMSSAMTSIVSTLTVKAPEYPNECAQWKRSTMGEFFMRCSSTYIVLFGWMLMLYSSILVLLSSSKKAIQYDALPCIHRRPVREYKRCAARMCLYSGNRLW